MRNIKIFKPKKKINPLVDKTLSLLDQWLQLELDFDPVFQEYYAVMLMEPSDKFTRADAIVDIIKMVQSKDSNLKGYIFTEVFNQFQLGISDIVNELADNYLKYYFKHNPMDKNIIYKAYEDSIRKELILAIQKKVTVRIDERYVCHNTPINHYKGYTNLGELIEHEYIKPQVQ